AHARADRAHAAADPTHHRTVLAHLGADPAHLAAQLAHAGAGAVRLGDQCAVGHPEFVVAVAEPERGLAATHVAADVVRLAAVDRHGAGAVEHGPGEVLVLGAGAVVVGVAGRVVAHRRAGVVVRVGLGDGVRGADRVGADTGHGGHGDSSARRPGEHRGGV